MQFCVTALGHNSGEVRDVAERIIKDLYREVKDPVKDYLPPDNEKNRKITLYRQLYEYFDKVDGKPSKGDLKVGFWIYRDKIGGLFFYQVNFILYIVYYSPYMRLDFVKQKFQKKRVDDEKKKQQEIDMLQQQLQQLKDMASGKQVRRISHCT